MRITGQITLKQEVKTTSSGATVQLEAFWKGGKLARLTKELLKQDALSGFQAVRRIDRSSIMLLQQPLRVIAEKEHYLVVMKDGWQAQAVLMYQTAIAKLTERAPSLFGWLKSQLV